MENKLIGEATPEQIQAWKEKYGDVYAIQVEGHICYLKRPDRKTISASLAIAQSNPIASNETLMRGAWLGGSEKISTDDKLFLAASAKAGEIIEIAEASLEKL